MVRLNGKAEILKHLRNSNGRGWSWKELQEHGAPIFRDREHPNIVWAYVDELETWSMERGLIGRLEPTNKPKEPNRAATYRSSRLPSGCEVCAWNPPGGRGLHVHHIVPKKRGGSDDEGNLIVLCPNDHVLAHSLPERMIGVISKSELIKAIRALSEKTR